MINARASPKSCSPPTRSEARLSKAIPRKASAPYPIVLRRTARRRKSHERGGTKSTAQLASNVAFVTEVSRMAKCHAARSKANAIPASQVHGERHVSLWRVFWCREMIQRIGTASAILQKAVAIGPVAARRTKIGANPMAIAPATSNKKDGTFTSGFARGKPSAPSGTCLMQNAVPLAALSSARDRGDPTNL